MPSGVPPHADLHALARAAKNATVIVGDEAFMALRTGEIVCYDAARVGEFGPRTWSRLKNARVTYARTTHDGRTVAMHRFVAGTQDLPRSSGICVDHENHDGLDNRAANVRVADYVTNGRNRRPNRSGTSRFKGVCRDPRVGCWCASITVAGRTGALGSFATEAQAALAYDAAAVEHFGEMARPNFPRATA